MTDARPVAGLVRAPVAELRPHPDNPRTRYTDIDALAASMREHGLLQPVVAERVPGRDGLQVLAGHRRLAAAKHLGWTHIPVLVRRDTLPDEALAAMLVENGQRTDLDPIEEARALQRLVKGGKTQHDVARMVGRHPSWVKARLDLLNLPPDEQEQLRAGHTTLGRAADLLRQEREQRRRQANPVARPLGRPKGARTRPYFGDTHPLARTARAICDHRGSPKVGGVACGPCWETTIRADAAGAIDTAMEATA